MTQPLPDEQPVGVAEMADRLGVTPYTVRKYARNGDIPGFKYRGKENKRAEWRFFESVVIAHLTAPPADDWQQSNQSRGRRRKAA